MERQEANRPAAISIGRGSARRGPAAVHRRGTAQGPRPARRRRRSGRRDVSVPAAEVARRRAAPRHRREPLGRARRDGSAVRPPRQGDVRHGAAVATPHGPDAHPADERGAPGEPLFRSAAAADRQARGRAGARRAGAAADELAGVKRPSASSRSRPESFA
jgi:hypothetical protein